MSPRVKPLRTRRWKKGSHQGITPEELQAMIKACKNDRYAKRNECMLLVGFSFGLRVSELLGLRVENIDLDNGQIHLERAKNGKTHDPAISKALQRTLKAYIKERGGKPTDFLFPSQWNNDKPLSRLQPPFCCSESRLPLLLIHKLDLGEIERQLFGRAAPHPKPTPLSVVPSP